MDERDYWLGFSVFSGIGPKRFKELLSQFGSAKTAWQAPRRRLGEHIGGKLAEKFDKIRSEFSFESYQAKLAKADVSFLTLSDSTYPEKLKAITNPPFVLYYRGNQDFNDTNHCSVGVVGTRRITSYGTEVTAMFTRELVDAGCVIISGLAVGVDAVAHKTTIETGGKTIAVLGCGVDCCSPRENQDLYKQILESGGAIVSEFPLSQQPSKGSFPSRNRIIAGLSDAVLVTEGAEDSGALITAQRALEQGRYVFAIPGPITSSLSKGPLKLIQQGAKLVTNGEDLLKELGIKNHELRKGTREIKGDNEEEQMIIDLLQNEALLFDEIVKQTRLSTANLTVTLSMMEMKGIIARSEGRFNLASGS